MTSNVNATSAGYGYSFYNTFKSGLTIAANALNDGAGPTISKIGEGLKVAFNEQYHAATTSMIAGAVFGYMTIKGANMVFDPLRFEWIEFDYRFKSKLELKGKLENLSELVNKISPDVLPGTAQVNAIAGSTAFQANKTAEELQTAADNAQVIADTAKTTRDLEKTNADIAEALATQAKDVTLPGYNLFAVLRTRNAAERATQRYVDASAAFDLVQIEANKAKEKAKKAKELSDGVKKQTEPPKKKEDTELPEGNYFLNYKVEKSKQKPGEYHLWLPMSNNAIIFKWDVFQESIKTSLAGVPTFTLGVLGGIDSLSKFAAELAPDEDIALNAAQNLNPQTISNWLLGDIGEKIAHVIGTPVQWTAGVAGNTAAWVASADTYGLSKLTAAVALGVGGFRLFTGGWGSFDKDKKWSGLVKPIDGVWYDIKKAKPGESIFTTSRYTLNKGVIARDIAKAVTGTAMIGAAILSANDFFSGNYSS